MGLADRAELFVGTYSGEGNRGLRPLRLNEAGDGWAVGPAEARIKNASFAAYSAGHGLYYFVVAVDEGRVETWSRSSDGEWTRLHRVTSGGSAPCFITTDPAMRRLAVANYKSGSVALYALDPGDGRIAGKPFIFQKQGDGS